MNSLKLSYILIYVVLPLSGFGQTLNLLPEKRHEFVVIAHRGNHTNAPENTILAYKNAIDIDVDFVEVDLRTSKDGKIIVLHDAKVDRMTGFKGNVKDFTYDSLKTMKIRSKEHPEWGEHTIPTFKEVLLLCKNKVNIYVDFKDASVAETYKEIQEAGMEKQVIVYVNSSKQFEDWRKVAPQVPLMVSLLKSVKTKSEMDTLLQSLKVDILDGNYEEYNSETVKAAHDMSIPVWADIQSESESPVIWDKAIKMGIRGLQTDHPEELINYLKKMNLRK